jgi:ribosomal protein S18 acetylase RimI-like enzyme
MLIRPAEPADAFAVARVHVRAWQVGYRKLLSDEYLDGLRPEDRAQRYTFGSTDPQKPMTIVAVEHGTVCGFATTAPTADADVFGYGELAALHVDPDSWGRGIGIALVIEARARLLDAGFSNAVLWVMVGNGRAQRLYTRDGWAPDGSRRTEEVWGAKLDAVRYRRTL